MRIAAKAWVGLAVAVALMVGGACKAAAAAQADVESRDGSGKAVVISGASYKLDGFVMYVTGKPFSLTETTTYGGPQPDGSARTSHVEEHAYRDAMGRFRLETGALRDGQFVARRVTIFDPVALTSVTFTTGSQKALLTKIGPRKRPTEEDKLRVDEQAARSAEFRGVHPEAGSEEALGSREFLGEQAFGLRTVTVFTANGNQPGLVRRREVWTAPEPGIPMLQIEDFRGVHYERSVTELTRAEPDAALFKVPEGYELEVQMQGAQGLSREGMTAPVVLYSPNPEYSKEARGKKINGAVVVSMRVMEDGSVADVRVKTGLGYGLDEKAVEAVKKYKFSPATRDGKPVATDLYVEVNFHIF